MNLVNKSESKHYVITPLQLYHWTK